MTTAATRPAVPDVNAGVGEPSMERKAPVPAKPSPMVTQKLPMPLALTPRLPNIWAVAMSKQLPIPGLEPITCLPPGNKPDPRISTLEKRIIDLEIELALLRAQVGVA